MTEEPMYKYLALKLNETMLLVSIGKYETDRRWSALLHCDRSGKTRCRVDAERREKSSTTLEPSLHTEYQSINGPNSHI